MTPWMAKNSFQVAAQKAGELLEASYTDIDFNELFTDKADPFDVEAEFRKLLKYLKWLAGDIDLKL